MIETELTEPYVIDFTGKKVIVQFNSGVNFESPGLYEWKIETKGSYIGKYKSKRRPLKEYRRNVQRLCAGKDYRKGNPNGFRKIHRALFEALNKGLHIELIILENKPWGEELNAREHELILERGNLNDQL
ncbi:MAG: hypothetical protein ACYCQJ_16260 [Nitrososphaerales archaeon]